MLWQLWMFCQIRLSAQPWVLVCFISILMSCDLPPPPKSQNAVLLSGDTPLVLASEEAAASSASMVASYAPDITREICTHITVK